VVGSFGVLAAFFSAAPLLGHGFGGLFLHCGAGFGAACWAALDLHWFSMLQSEFNWKHILASRPFAIAPAAPHKFDFI